MSEWASSKGTATVDLQQWPFGNNGPSVTMALRQQPTEVEWSLRLQVIHPKNGIWINPPASGSSTYPVQQMSLLV